MLSKHKNSVLISFAGLVLLVAIAYVMLTKTKISLAEKSIETNGNVISYEFKEIPLMSVAMLVADASGGKANLQGLDLLSGILVTAKADKVHAFDFFDALLKDNGLQVDRQIEFWQFSKL